MRKLLYQLIILIVFCGICAAEDIYIAASAAGDESGSSCANSKAYTFFNDAGNWGGGAGEIDPGDTVHICGTITGAANSTLLTFQASGTSGSVITLKFEDGAILEAPYFGAGGAININDKDYIKITGYDSTHYGTIKNTDCGTEKTYTLANAGARGNPSYGINTNGGSNIEICYLTIDDIYINVGVDTINQEDGWNTANILVDDDSAYSTIKIHHNNLYDAHAGIWVNYELITVTGLEIYNNLIDGHAWGIVIGAGINGSVMTDVDVHDNEITNWAAWGEPYHTDGFAIFGDAVTATFTGKFYNNYVHGDLLTYSPTGYVGVGCGGDNFLIYNNLFVCDESAAAGSCMVVYNAGGCGTGVQPINTTFLNNTVIGSSNQNTNSAGLAIRLARPATNMTIKNNIFTKYNVAIDDAYADHQNLEASTIDYNLYYDFTVYSGHYRIARDAAPTYYTLALMQSTFNEDNNSLELTNPTLDANYKPQLTSPDFVKTGGFDLSGTFTTDKDGTTRVAPWSIGAYEYEVGGSDYTLTLTIAGSGTGTVTSSPSGINTSATTTENFDDGTVVTLTATATLPNYFVGWSGTGGCTGTSTCVLTMSAAKAATATFSRYGTATIGSGGSMTIGSGGSLTLQ